MKPKIKIGSRAKLVRKLLIVEGITRAGKFLLANLLHGFYGIEPVQYYGLLENIPFLEKFGLIDTETAKEILHCEIDTHCYEMLIGRNLNHRKSDKSSIYNSARPNEYLVRAKEPDGDDALAKFKGSDSYSFFIAHELMPHIDLYFKTFPKMKIISINRSPSDLVYSWYRRGHGHRWGNDPKVFQIVFKKQHSIIPWFAVDWKEDYYKLSEIDRIIASIKTITQKGQAAYHKLSAEEKKRILFIKYEDIITKPKKVINKISDFLKKKERPEMSSILRREKIPNFIGSNSDLQKKQEILGLASHKWANELEKLEKNYQTGL